MPVKKTKRTWDEEGDGAARPLAPAAWRVTLTAPALIPTTPTSLLAAPSQQQNATRRTCLHTASLVKDHRRTQRPAPSTTRPRTRTRRTFPRSGWTRAEHPPTRRRAQPTSDDERRQNCSGHMQFATAPCSNRIGRTLHHGGASVEHLHQHLVQRPRTTEGNPWWPEERAGETPELERHRAVWQYPDRSQ
jgi:hypothetical protein